MEPDHEFGEDVEGLAAKAMRPPMRLSCEDLVASELASAILSEPLSKIRHVCEALMLLDEGERKQAGITEDEVREAEKLYALAMALQNAYIDKEVDPTIHVIVERYAVIPWPFPVEKANEWLEWIGEDFEGRYWPHGSDEHRKELKDALKKLSHFEAVHHITSEQEATMETYKGIIIRFINHAMPKAAALMKKIIKLVSPDSYREALKILRGAKRAKA